MFFWTKFTPTSFKLRLGAWLERAGQRLQGKFTFRWATKLSYWGAWADDVKRTYNTALYDSPSGVLPLSKPRLSYGDRAIYCRDLGSRSFLLSDASYHRYCRKRKSCKCPCHKLRRKRRKT